MTYQAIALAIILTLILLQRTPLLIAAAFTPMTFKVLVGAYRWQDKHSLSLPRLGMIEVIHSIVFAVLVIVAFA